MRYHLTFRIAAAVATATLAIGSGAVSAKPGQGGGGQSNNTAPKFDVAVTQHLDDKTDHTSGKNLWAPPADCLGETPDAKTKEVVTVVFFHHQECAELTPSSGPSLIDDLTIRTSEDSNGNIGEIQISGQDAIGRDGISYRSDLIQLVSPVTPQRGGSFTIHVHEADANLYNCNAHLIRNNTVCGPEASGTFSIDDITYTCVDYCEAASTIESTIRYWPGYEPQ